MRPLLAVLAAASALSLAPMAIGQPSSTLEVKNIPFGPSERLEGVYFTNWENSLFSDCPEAASACDDAWVLCERSACEDLDARIEALNGSSENPARFRVVFQGRRSIGKTPKRFLHDREDRIYLERIERFELIRAP